MRRYRPNTDKDPLGQENRKAIHRIVGALKDLENMRRGLEDAKYNLGIAVDYAPNTVRQNFQQFWRSGGCNLAQYREWLVGKRPRNTVLRRRHLRLVTNQKQRQQVRLVRRRFAGPDDGPTAA
jgi:hypothetical protein